MTTDTQTLISDVLEANGYELVEAEYAPARQLWRIFIDRPESRRGVDLIGLEDCAAASGLVEDALIAADVAYEHLEVSSPGIDRALTKPGHFLRFAGESVKLTLQPPVNGERKLIGDLVGFEQDQVIVMVDGTVNKVPYANVTRARVLPQY